MAEVESTFWDYALARRRIEIVEKPLTVVCQQLRETEELTSVGRLARAELAAVRAEVAAREQALIEAQARKETIHLRLLRADQSTVGRRLGSGSGSGPCRCSPRSSGGGCGQTRN